MQDSCNPDTVREDVANHNGRSFTTIFGISRETFTSFATNSNIRIFKT